MTVTTFTALGGGLDAADRTVVEQGLARAVTRLKRTAVAGTHGELSVKERDKPGMKTTWEVWLPGSPRLVATSSAPVLEQAMAELSARMIDQLSSQRGREQDRRTAGPTPVEPQEATDAH